MGSLSSRCASACCPCSRHPILKREPSFSDILTNQSLERCNEVETNQPKKQYSWDTRPKQNPLDYTISDLRDGEQRVKRPGEVNGQQFIIRNCSNSKIYLFDHISQLTIDDCVDCLIVTGPIQGSLFLRDTKNSTLVSASSQLRLRDCQNIHLFVGTESDPIIEASSEVVVGPYFLSYKAIREHFNSAKLNRFKAVHWSSVYDFTPNDLAPNWRCYDRTKHLPEKYICPPHPPESYADLEISISDKFSSFIPVTHPNPTDYDAAFLGKWRKQEMTFSPEPGQDLAQLEERVEKFYLNTIILKSAFLCDLKTDRNQYVFTYYTPQRQSLLHSD